VERKLKNDWKKTPRDERTFYGVEIMRFGDNREGLEGVSQIS